MPRIPKPFTSWLVPDGECLVWTGRIHYRTGYGKYRPPGATHATRKEVEAHRFALERKLGRPIAPGMMALHRCDNPPCCLEDHLYEGTHAQNMADMVRRGRSTRKRDTP